MFHLQIGLDHMFVVRRSSPASAIRFAHDTVIPQLNSSRLVRELLDKRSGEEQVPRCDVVPWPLTELGRQFQ
jgi:hypothetical protein